MFSQFYLISRKQSIICSLSVLSQQNCNWTKHWTNIKIYGCITKYRIEKKITLISFLHFSKKSIAFNPITYGILPFRQLRGGLFGPDPENKVTVNGLIWNLAQIMVWMILVTMQNFKLMAFLLLEIWRHKNFLSKMERVIVIRYLPPGFKQNSTKITFYAWKHLFWHKVIPPSVFPLFSSKNKNFIGSIFRDVSFQKQLQQPPW